MNKETNNAQANTAICDAIQAAADLNNYICRALNMAYNSDTEMISDAQERIFCPALDLIKEGLSELLEELAGRSADLRISCTPAPGAA